MTADQSIPKELAQPLPRPTRVLPSELTYTFLFAWLYFVFGFFLIGLIYFSTARLVALHRTGLLTDGVVEGRHTETGHSGVTYVVAYGFHAVGETLDTASRWHGRTAVTEAAYAALHVGDRVIVLYQPSQPEISELQISIGYADGWSAPIFVSSTYLVFALFKSVVFIANYRKQRWLLRWGTAAPATINAEEPYTRMQGKSVVSYIRIRYQFKDTTGCLHTGARRGVINDKKTPHVWPEPFQPQDQANPLVVYDPNRPTRNLLYPPTIMTCRLS